MKAVMISIQPKWIEKIAKREETIEVQKTRPKEETPFKCYIYCTKGENLWLTQNGVKSKTELAGYLLNGKVIGEFVCDKVYPIKNQGSMFSVADEEQSVTNEIARQSCLDYYDMVSYLGNKDGYGWHISDLHIYDKPKELSEFRKPLDSVYCSYYRDYCEEGCVGFGSTDYVCNDYWNWEKGLTRPPQSWQYVEEL